jgi:hypothetical protein
MYTKFKNDCERPGYTRVTLCFAGFYNSLFSDRLDSQIEQDAEYYGIDAGELCDAVSWGRAHTYIAKDYCGHFGEWLKAIGFEAIDFSFVALHTPKDYFQGPDTIEAEASTEALRKLFDAVMYEYESELRAYWCNRFTPCSGWIPFYPADMDACGPCEQWPSCLWQVFFDFLDSIQDDYGRAEWWYDDIALANGAYGEALCESPEYSELIETAAEAKEA